jgi:hypothetical protein
MHGSFQGRSLAVFACAADSSDADVSANLNTLLGRYGIAVNRDALFSIVQQVLWLQMVQRLLTQGMPCSRYCGAAYHAFGSRSTWWLMHGRQLAQGTLRPREVLVSDGPLCTAVSAAAAVKASAASDTAGQEEPAGSMTNSAAGSMPRRSRDAVAATPAAAGQLEAAAAKAELLCCDGCTLAVSGTAQPLLLSGSMCNPPLRPLGEGPGFHILVPDTWLCA